MSIFTTPITPTGISYHEEKGYIGAYCFLEGTGSVMPLIIDQKTGFWGIDLTQAITHTKAFKDVEEYLQSNQFLDFINALNSLYEDEQEFVILEINSRTIFANFLLQYATPYAKKDIV